MTEVKKSRPRGRPPVPDTEKRVRNFTFRSRGDMHDRLARSAADNQRSISEEIERRLDASWQFEERLIELQMTWAARLDDVRAIADNYRAAADEARRHFEEVTAKESEKIAELEKQVESVERSASLVDVMLGSNEASRDLIRSVAIELMSNPDWDGSIAGRKAMADRIHDLIYQPDVLKIIRERGDK